MKWKLYFSSNAVDRKHQILFRRDFGVNPSKPDITKDLKYKFFTRSDPFSYAATIEQWIPATNNIVIAYDGKTLPTYNYMYAVALDDYGNPLPFDYCFFVTDYDVVSAGAIRFYLEPDDFQNYFNLQITGTTPNHYITGTCIQTNSQTILNGVEKHHIVEPTPKNGLKTVEVLNGEFCIVLCSRIGDEVQTNVVVQYNVATDPEDEINRGDILKFVTKSQIVQTMQRITEQTKAKNYNYQAHKNQDGTITYQYIDVGEINTDFISVFAVPYNWIYDYTTLISTDFYLGSYGFVEIRQNANFSATVQIPTNPDLRNTVCGFGTNLHRFRINPQIESFEYKINISANAGIFKIQLSLNGNATDITDDFEFPIIFSSAAQQYAQQSIFRNINAVVGALGVGGQLAKGNVLGAITSGVNIAESFIKPQTPYETTGVSNGLINLNLCNGIALFYFETLNELAMIGFEAEFGFNIQGIATLSNEVLSTDPTGKTWYKFNNAQFITQYVPIAKRQAIEQMFNDGIFITKVYNDT